MLLYKSHFVNQRPDCHKNRIIFTYAFKPACSKNLTYCVRNFLTEMYVIITRYFDRFDLHFHGLLGFVLFSQSKRWHQPHSGDLRLGYSLILR